jgi:uncharacterized protein YdeI (YjbR/CyaY-like superfamily)
MELHNNLKTFHAKNRSEWRNWLNKNHQSEKSIWLIIYKKESQTPSIYYPQAVDEALCFGWIDSKPNKRDENSYYQFFTKRNPKSSWSKVNKEKVTKLIEQGLMHSSGLEMIEIAKQNCSWTILDDAEALIIPKDLDDEFEKRPDAKTYFLGLSRSDKRNILQWIILAKRKETRQKRIKEIVELADIKQKPKQFGGQKNRI